MVHCDSTFPVPSEISAQERAIMAALARQLQAAFDDLGFARVSVSLGESDGAVELLSLSVDKKNLGLEAAAVSNLTELADELGVDLTLIVPGRAGRPKFNELVAFYTRFGFELGADDRMCRHANRVR
jgi:hypothetical protein